jgi:hypothetical protein
VKLLATEATITPSIPPGGAGGSAQPLNAGIVAVTKKAMGSLALTPFWLPNRVFYAGVVFQPHDPTATVAGAVALGVRTSVDAISTRIPSREYSDLI